MDIKEKKKMKLKDKLTMVISSCDAYSDLWDNHVKLLEENWPDREIPAIIVTDRKNNKIYNTVSVFAAGEDLEMPDRLKIFFQSIDTEYVLITLDDYYINKTIYTTKIIRAVKIMDRLSLDYLRFWPYPHEKKKVSNIKNAYWIELNGNYKVNLYPGIWKKSFIEKTLTNSLSAWEYEVSLTKLARELNAKCAYSVNGEFPILDVVRKGKLLHPAKRYLDSRNMKLDRDVISYKQEIKLGAMYYGKEIIPKSILKILKKILVKMGYSFISDGI